MIIRFKNSKVKKQCRDIRQARKEFPNRVPEKLFQIINFIEAAENLESVINNPVYRFHDLKGRCNGLYAMDIAGRKSSYRLIVTFEGVSKEQVFTEAITIVSIEIEEVSNHYE